MASDNNKIHTLFLFLFSSDFICFSLNSENGKSKFSPNLIPPFLGVFFLVPVSETHQMTRSYTDKKKRRLSNLLKHNLAGLGPAIRALGFLPVTLFSLLTSSQQTVKPNPDSYSDPPMRGSGSKASTLPGIFFFFSLLSSFLSSAISPLISLCHRRRLRRRSPGPPGGRWGDLIEQR